MKIPSHRLPKTMCETCGACWALQQRRPLTLLQRRWRQTQPTPLQEGEGLCACLPLGVCIWMEGGL